jgi:hypothetical protein
VGDGERRLAADSSSKVDFLLIPASGSSSRKTCVQPRFSDSISVKLIIRNRVVKSGISLPSGSLMKTLRSALNFFQTASLLARSRWPRNSLAKPSKISRIDRPAQDVQHRPLQRASRRRSPLALRTGGVPPEDLHVIRLESDAAASQKRCKKKGVRHGHWARSAPLHSSQRVIANCPAAMQATAGRRGRESGGKGVHEASCDSPRGPAACTRLRTNAVMVSMIVAIVKA